jgi:hypothetical protein
LGDLRESEGMLGKAFEKLKIALLVKDMAAMVTFLCMCVFFFLLFCVFVFPRFQELHVNKVLEEMKVAVYGVDTLFA